MNIRCNWAQAYALNGSDSDDWYRCGTCGRVTRFTNRCYFDDQKAKGIVR